MDLNDPAFLEWQECDLGMRVVRHPLYRFSQMCGVLASVASIPSFVRLFTEHFFRLGFHFNIKFILVVYYTIAFMEAIIFIISQGKQFIYGFLVGKPCDIFLNRYEYMIIHVANLFLVQYQLWLLVAMWLERLVATAKPSKYERNTKTLGPILSLLVAIPPISGMWWAYEAETFSEKATDVINTPLTSATKINELLAAQLAICLLGIVIVTILWKYNNSQLKKTRYDLPTQYQLSENVTATCFILRLSIFTIVFYIILYTGTLAVRFARDSIIFRGRFPLFQGLRSITYVLPLFTLFLPIASQMFRASDRREFDAKRAEMLASSESRGDAGWRIYSDMLDKQWNEPEPPGRRNTRA